MAGVYDMVIARTPVNKQAAVAASFPRHLVQEDKLDWREHREGSRSNCALPSDGKRTGRLLFKWASRFLRNERLDRGKLVNAILEHYNVSWPTLRPVLDGSREITLNLGNKRVIGDWYGQRELNLYFSLRSYGAGDSICRVTR